MDERRAREERREQAAVARWKPGRKWYHPLLAALVIRTSKFVMTSMNKLDIEGLERLHALQKRGDRGLLTFSNHVSLLDDPLLVSNFGLTDYGRIRWIAADAINFFGSRPKAWLFTAGKAVPIVRGAGLDQPGLRFLSGRLREGQWVHIFPEGGRTRDPQALLSHPLKPGIGYLMAETRPLLLPFYHTGMREVLPVGAVRPRRGYTARVTFGEALDCNAEFVRQAAQAFGDESLSGQPLWDALAARAYEALRALELQHHPAAASMRA